MTRSLAKLTDNLRENKADNDKDGALAYLKFIVEKKEDEKYIKTMRLVLQGIMINKKYREQWLEWYNTHIIPADADDLDTKSLIVFLVADAIWFADNMGSKQLSDNQKQDVFNFLKRII